MRKKESVGAFTLPPRALPPPAPLEKKPGTEADCTYVNIIKWRDDEVMDYQQSANLPRPISAYTKLELQGNIHEAIENQSKYDALPRPLSHCISSSSSISSVQSLGARLSAQEQDTNQAAPAEPIYSTDLPEFQDPPISYEIARHTSTYSSLAINTTKQNGETDEFPGSNEPVYDTICGPSSVGFPKKASSEYENDGLEPSGAIAMSLASMMKLTKDKSGSTPPLNEGDVNCLFILCPSCSNVSNIFSLSARVQILHQVVKEVK